MIGQLMGLFEKTDGMSPLWAGIKKVDAAAVTRAVDSKVSWKPPVGNPPCTKAAWAIFPLFHGSSPSPPAQLVCSICSSFSSQADVNETLDGLTPLHYIARQGHYKYVPDGIPQSLIKAGANLEAKDGEGRTALQVSLLKGWQKIGYLLVDSGADTSGVASIKNQASSLSSPLFTQGNSYKMKRDLFAATRTPFFPSHSCSLLVVWILLVDVPGLQEASGKIRPLEL